jgi:hypothetical protein
MLLLWFWGLWNAVYIELICRGGGYVCCEEAQREKTRHRTHNGKQNDEYFRAHRISLAAGRTLKKHPFWSANISYSHSQTRECTHCCGFAQTEKYTTSYTHHIHYNTKGYSSNTCLRYHTILCAHNTWKLRKSSTNKYITSELFKPDIFMKQIAQRYHRANQ